MGGRLCEVAYSNQQEGDGRLCPLAMPVTVVQPGFVNGGPKVGIEATKRPNDRENFETVCMKTAFSCTLIPLLILGGVYEVE